MQSKIITGALSFLLIFFLSVGFFAVVNAQNNSFTLEGELTPPKTWK
jgi:hypothetical protein